MARMTRSFLLLIFANILDAVLTVAWGSVHPGLEWNPLMRGLIEDHWLIFLVTKTLIGNLAVILLWRLREHGWVSPLVRILLFLFVPVFLLHAAVLMGASGLHPG